LRRTVGGAFSLRSPSSSSTQEGQEFKLPSLHPGTSGAPCSSFVPPATGDSSQLDRMARFDGSASLRQPLRGRPGLFARTPREWLSPTTASDASSSMPRSGAIGQENPNVVRRNGGISRRLAEGSGINPSFGKCPQQGRTGLMLVRQELMPAIPLATQGSFPLRLGNSCLSREDSVVERAKLGPSE
jgi:hypothetical protein